MLEIHSKFWNIKCILNNNNYYYFGFYINAISVLLALLHIQDVNRYFIMKKAVTLAHEMLILILYLTAPTPLIEY